MATLYPERSPFDQGYLDVGDGHALNYKRFGNPSGQPVIYLHGGPGGGCSFQEYRWFHPDHFNVLLFEQRGAGESKPQAETHMNDIPHLVEDIEIFRNKFKVDQWSICGGSWGSALAMFYNAAYPDHVRRMLLRGVFFADTIGADHITEAWGTALKNRNTYFDQYQNHIPEDERANGLKVPYYNRVMSDDPAIAMKAARLFSVWDHSVATHLPSQKMIEGADQDSADNLALSRLWFHYAVNHFKVRNKDYLLNNMKLAQIPISIIHGQQDHLCPVDNARLLHKTCQNSTLVTPDKCGHAQAEPALLDAFIAITNQWMRDDLSQRAQPAPSPAP